MTSHRTLPVLLAVLCLVVFAVAPAAAQERLRVGTREVPPFVVREADGTFGGISIELFAEVARDLELSYDLEERSLEGLLDGVRDGTLDVAVAAISVTAERDETMDFTHPFFTSGLGIAVPADGGGGFGALLEKLVSPQFLGVVGALLALLFGVGVVVWVLERRRNAEQFGGKPLEGIGSGFWWSAVTMTTVGYGDKAPRTLLGRLVGLIWMFAGVILVASFTASLASALTVGELASDIRGPRDLVGRQVATVRDSTSATYLRRQGIGLVEYANVSRALAAVAEGKCDAAVYDAPLLRYVALQEQAGKVVVLPGTFQREDYAFALPADSALREPLNRALLRRISAPEWGALIRRYLGE